PCRPAIFDLDTVTTTLAMVKLAGKLPHTVAVLNAVAPTGHEREEASVILRDLGVPVAPCAFGHRKVFQFAAAVGQSAEEFEPDGHAATEIDALFRFIR